ncbi:MAG: hypothetical protein A2847_02680 [Candidatus Sungbacteria bacterium RIFCSPHIGHO2_01_FULL_50_25]|uniref:Type 4 fimbrial biogenesis protein PilX N-terminal domain-containing protein n=1 Tax=Candidatus Sungbacteria bacterium RIFCSPHIGHO2_01_FULL_50_25 TaxID=1802265 RepID=A0A1G2KBR4_9BACT|nr:MAG: hypothetical protein A2847_02680 [Candidatus Sungbacteria bacterium RIFCSPHIGHO2_01_FULL_50_25]
MRFFFKVWSKTAVSARQNPRSGVTLLLAVSILAALSSISYAMFTIVFSQIYIAGELTSSFVALYAADEGIEKALYDDRVRGILCSSFGSPCVPVINPSFIDSNALSGGCYSVRMDKSDIGGGLADNSLKVTGQSFCGPGASRFVRRAFELIYTSAAP